MTDSRLIAANRRVAAANLRGQVQAEEFVDGVQMSVLPPMVDLKSAPNGSPYLKTVTDGHLSKG